ncbi:SAV_915 family protein [Actinomycetota bacterium Odt1-20B]
MTHRIEAGDAGDSEPLERTPAGPLFVPVRPGAGACAARIFRTPMGGRTAVGFTSERLLAAALGPAHAWIRLAEPALRELTRPVGVTELTVDPRLTAPAPIGTRSAAPGPRATVTIG